jgi:hypothetical protein
VGPEALGHHVRCRSHDVLGLRLYGDFAAHRFVAPLHVVFEALNVAMLMIWIWWITPPWVMIAGEAYAERLLDALDTFPEPTINQQGEA